MTKDEDLTRMDGPDSIAAPQPAAENHEAPSGCEYNEPLTVTMERCALVIRIGVRTLAHAVTYSDWANQYEYEMGDYLRKFAITDAEVFANDVRHAMLSEREDGSTPLTDFIDKMTRAAVEDGSEATDEANIKHGETDQREEWSWLHVCKSAQSVPAVATPCDEGKADPSRETA
jgi:hypothetical protein